VPILCRRAGGDFFTQFEPVDISFGGLRVYSSEAYPVRGRVRLDLFFPHSAPVTFATQVSWIRPATPGAPARFDLGLAFVQLTPQAMGALLPFVGPESDSAQPESAESAAGVVPRPADSGAVVIMEDELMSERRLMSAPRSFLSEIPVRVVGDELLRAAPLDARAGFILFLLDGATTVESLLDLSAMPADETLALLQELQRHGIIEFR
jgi:hypothetical protein